MSAMKMNELFHQLYLTKSSEWSYENEFRVIAHDYDATNPLSLLKPIPAVCISSIVLGARFDEYSEQGQKLLLAIEQFNIRNQTRLPVYRATLIENAFQLTVPDHPILDKKTLTLRHFLCPSTSQE